MKKNIYSFIIILCISVLAVNAQTMHTVNPGDDLIQVVADAADGDTVMVMAGFHKANYDYIRVIDKSIVMMGESGADKPKVYFERINLENTESSDVPVGLTLDGIEFSGFDIDSVTGEENTEGDLIGEYFINLDGSLKTFTDIIAKNCIIRNVQVTSLRGDRSNYTGNGFEFDNCVIHDIRDANDNGYPPFRLNKDISFEYFKLTNSTMYDVVINIIDCENLTGFPLDVTVDNCTFYNFGGKKPGEYIFDFKASTDLSFTLKDCIFANTADDPTASPDPITVYGFRFPEDGPDINTVISTTAFTADANFDASGVDDVVWDQKLYVYEDVDPGFTDPDNGDFTLPSNSDLLTSSEEGSIIGDPRWDPNATGIETEILSNNVKIYPIPTSGNVTIHLKRDNTIKIFSVTGQIVYSEFLKAGKNNINISNLNRGMYIVTDTNNKFLSKLLIK